MNMVHFSLPFPLAHAPEGYLHFTTEGNAVRAVTYATSPLKTPLPPQFSALKEALAEYCAGEPVHRWPVAFALSGSPFFMQTWRVLSSIPYGHTLSYSEVAQRSGRPKAIRAAASACARNPVPILIPCHRIIAKDGGLGGFAWGLTMKRSLLNLEKQTTHRAAA